MKVRRIIPTFVALTLLGVVALPAAAQCPAFICYLDLVNGAAICPNSSVYSNVRMDPIVNTSANPGCDVNRWHAAVVQVDLPAGCSALEITTEFSGVPEGWVLNVGDSASNNGFGGDFDSPPIGQNAELQILDEQLDLWAAIDDPPGYTLASQGLALRDGALKVVVKDQEVSWSQPYTNVESRDGRLFNLPSVGDRSIYAAFNRVVFPHDDSEGTRNGCGASHVLMFTKP